MTSPTHPHRTPRTPGRPREFDLDRALDRAIAIFSSRGFNGTSISDLAQAMEVTAGSLYKAFPDKRAIFMSALERYVTLRQEKVRQRIATRTLGRDQIEALLLSYAESSSGAQGRQGCLVVETAAELSSVDPDVASRITQILAKYEQRLEDLIRTGQQDGSIPVHVVAETVGPLLLCITQGMRVVGKAGRSAKQTRALVSSAMKLLD